MNELQPITQSGEALQALAQVAAHLPARKQEDILRQCRDLGSALGKDGYYLFPVGDKTVEGLSVHAADELAKILGGIAIQVPTYDLDRESGHLTMMVRVVDLRNLVIQERPHFFTLAPAPAKFAAKPEQIARWEAMQCQAATSKAIRTTFLHVAGKVFVKAMLGAAKGKEAAGIEPKADTRKEAMSALREYMSEADITKRWGKMANWDAPTIAEMRATYRGFKEEGPPPEQARTVIDQPDHGNEAKGTASSPSTLGRQAGDDGEGA